VRCCLAYAGLYTENVIMRWELGLYESTVEDGLLKTEILECMPEI